MKARIVCLAFLTWFAAAAMAQSPSFKIPARSVPDALVSEWKQAPGPPNAALARLSTQIDAELPRVKAVLVVKDKQLVFEHYRKGYGPDDLHNVASVTKSVVSALIGIAVEEGHLKSLDQKAGAVLPPGMLPAVDSRFEDVTVRHLLTMTSGFARSAGAGGAKPGQALKRPMAAAAGRVFSYDNGAQHLLSVVLTQQTGQSAARFAEQKLFAPLGITHYNWFEDDEGYSYGSHDLYLRPRDMARIGQLYLQKGEWQGRRIVSAAFVDASTTRHVETQENQAGYGYLWWITTALGTTPAYSAAGYGGQYIFVVPSQSLVVVAVSDQESKGEGAGFIRQFVLPAVGP